MPGPQSFLSEQRFSLTAAMEGYDRIAPLMAEYRDVAMFRKFSILNNRMLCYTQAQLIEKENRLIHAIKADLNSGDEARMKYAFNFRAIGRSLGQGEGTSTQRELMDAIRPLLSFYST
jgi:hypothetical protein